MLRRDAGDPRAPAWQVGAMPNPDPQTFEVKTGAAWITASLDEAAAQHIMAVKRRPACHGRPRAACCSGEPGPVSCAPARTARCREGLGGAGEQSSCLTPPSRTRAATRSAPVLSHSRPSLGKVQPPLPLLPPVLPVDPAREGWPALPAAAESGAMPSAARPVGV